MQIAADWGRSVGIEVPVDKTVMMLMKGSLSHTRTRSVRYGAHAVKYVTEVKYLGLAVRKRLNFNYHLQSVNEKLRKSVGAVKRVLRVHRATKKSRTLQFYELVLSLLTESPKY